MAEKIMGMNKRVTTCLVKAAQPNKRPEHIYQAILLVSTDFKITVINKTKKKVKNVSDSK